MANRLCRCRYRECNKFFLIDPAEVIANRRSPQGRVRRDYCIDAHRGLEQKLTNKERAQKNRDELKAKRLAKARKHK